MALPKQKDYLQLSKHDFQVLLRDAAKTDPKAKEEIIAYLPFSKAYMDKELWEIVGLKSPISLVQGYKEHRQAMKDFIFSKSFVFSMLIVYLALVRKYLKEYQYQKLLQDALSYLYEIEVETPVVKREYVFSLMGYVITKAFDEFLSEELCFLS